MKTILPEHFGKGILPEHFGKCILPAFFVKQWILCSTHNRRCENKTRENKCRPMEKKSEITRLFINKCERICNAERSKLSKVEKSSENIGWMETMHEWAERIHTHTNCIVVRFTASSYPRLNTFFSRMFPATWALVPVNIMLKIVKHPELSAFFLLLPFFHFFRIFASIPYTFAMHFKYLRAESCRQFLCFDTVH